jgi:hypothetical protein
MKWYKHISDSLDDPYIFNLMTECGSDGYLVFFGILEIYSREFKPELGWKLLVTQAYLKQKFQKRQATLIINSLKHIKNSGKWEIDFIDDKITIYIPKFKELIDEYTIRKISKNPQNVVTLSGHSTKNSNTDKEEDKELELDKEKDNIYTDEFLRFYNYYPNRKEKKDAFARWEKLNGKRPSLEVLLEAIRKQIEWRNNAQEGEFRPGWKNPATWLNKGCWDDECKSEKSSLKEWARKSMEADNATK